MLTIILIILLLIGLVAIASAVFDTLPETGRPTGDGCPSSNPVPSANQGGVRGSERQHPARAPSSNGRGAGDARKQERNRQRQRPARAPSHPPSSNGHQLDAQETIRSFEFILRSFGLAAPWASAKNKDDYIHDLAVMFEHGDLSQASLELLGPDRSVVYRHTVHFGSTDGRRAIGPARVNKLPILPPESVADHRMLVAPFCQVAHYRQLLRLSWSTAEKLPDRPGSRFENEHKRSIHRGRATGQVFVSDEARRIGTILNVSPAGDYAFARDPSLPVDVYLHRAQCDEAIKFEPGMKVSFIPTQVPRGVQGCSIRRA